MNHETQTSGKPELTRKQKLARRFLPAVLIAGGASVLGLEVTDDKDVEPGHLAEATVSTHASAEFKGAEDDWGHGTAEDLIHYAVGKGASEAFANIQGSQKTPEEIAKLVEDLPVYNQANEALELAGYGEVLPGEGDVLSIDVAVTADTEDHVSYEIVDAEITDIENNR